ncbi:MAG: DUF2155 domain-containing protein, partial [Alphaproteobacteria bacterium]|nr:DUF2155 domain-containing protein [Alphaproteobacteria bacterium]
PDRPADLQFEEIGQQFGPGGCACFRCSACGRSGSSPGQSAGSGKDGSGTSSSSGPFANACAFACAFRSVRTRSSVIRFVPFVFALLAAFPALAAVPTEDRPIAELRVLDKITARVEQVNVPIERPLKFGTLVITVYACRVTPPEETPEAAAFIDVNEIKPGAAETNVFRGWMFASSPALSAMENPVYDLWVTGCKSEAAK